MNATVLLMAGGQSSRMRSSGDATHKALRRVGGRTLLDRNLARVLSAGFRDIVVAVSDREHALEAYLDDVAGPAARASGATFETIRETRPLGNIGAAGLLCDRRRDVLVVYVDNLCALDLTDLVAKHRAGGFAATFAAHEETFVDPYGELVLDGDEIVAYREKPVRRVRVSSGTCVVAPRAARTLPRDRATGANEFFAALRASGERVGAYRHDAPWVDVNDVASLARAERIVAEYPSLFAMENLVR